ncbi:MAG TPA: lipopolysaccharide transport periplasmic protein LptA [Frateuria sp.]|uniref:lipopolysaccharide transport periplasmic protein LptA n=1 Tax=Frateuria sp. TaxID=2211372 RepID=UPI002D7EB31C|nr:lipopolysaccharide transport periplasmic protein LptA [Frateuria sp.]HET6804614.1 lipopolysaccharide transport periplasmic protein LptA [Frateuria sp.]
MRASWMLALLGLLVLAPALAKRTDRDQPMDVQASHFDGFRKPNSTTTLKGNVVITQGSLKATGDLAKVHFDANAEIDSVVLTGSPAHIRQLDDNGNLMQGEAASIDYQVARDFAVLQGHASINQQGRGEAHGDRLTYNTQTSEMTGDSGGDGRVHMIFKPKPKPKPGAAAPAAAPAPAASAPAPAHATSSGQP